MYMITQVVLGYLMYHALGLSVMTGSLSCRTCGYVQLQMRCSVIVGLRVRCEMLDLPFYLGMGQHIYRVRDPSLTWLKCVVNAI